MFAETDADLIFLIKDFLDHETTTSQIAQRSPKVSSGEQFTIHGFSNETGNDIDFHNAFLPAAHWIDTILWNNLRHAIQAQDHFCKVGNQSLVDILIKLISQDNLEITLDGNKTGQRWIWVNTPILRAIQYDLDTSYYDTASVGRFRDHEVYFNHQDRDSLGVLIHGWGSPILFDRGIGRVELNHNDREHVLIELLADHQIKTNRSLIKRHEIVL